MHSGVTTSAWEVAFIEFSVGSLPCSAESLIVGVLSGITSATVVLLTSAS